jgi:hypothetical protein
MSDFIDNADRHVARDMFQRGISTVEEALIAIRARKIETGHLPKRLLVVGRDLAKRWTHPLWKEQTP